MPPNRSIMARHSINSKTVDVEVPFFEVGDKIELDGQTLKMNYEPVHTPPLHPNCRCTISAVLD